MPGSVSGFVCPAQATRMHQIMGIDFENYIFFSASEGAHQTPPVPTDAKALSVLNLSTPAIPLFLKIVDPPM